MVCGDVIRSKMVPGLFRGAEWFALANSKAGEVRFYCLDVHLDFPNGRRKHKQHRVVINFRIKIDAG